MASRVPAPGDSSGLVPLNLLGLSSGTNAQVTADMHPLEQMVKGLQETVQNQEKVIQDLSEKIRLNELAVQHLQMGQDQQTDDLCDLRNGIDTTHGMAESSRVALSNLTKQHNGTQKQLDNTEYWILRCLRNIQKILRYVRFHQIGNANNGQVNPAVVDQSRDDSGSPASQEAVSKTKDINGKGDEQKAKE